MRSRSEFHRDSHDLAIRFQPIRRLHVIQPLGRDEQALMPEWRNLQYGGTDPHWRGIEAARSFAETG